MRIGIVASEGVPFSKTGGLADVSGSLFKEFAKLGHKTYFFLPYYRNTKGVFDDFDDSYEFSIKIGEKILSGCALIKEYYKDARVVLIQQDEYFDRRSLYGEAGIDYADNGERFGFFSKAIPYIISGMKLNIEVLHLNDWQTGLIPIFLKDHNLDIKTYFTIHNLAYQGNFDPIILRELSIDYDYFNIDGLEFYGKVSFIKAGIVYSDMIGTVSPSYASEIKTEKFGENLHGILKTKGNSLHGILNGVDYDVWNPVSDSYIYQRYSISEIERKEVNKMKLVKELGLLDAKVPLFGIVGRVASQKGFDILTEALTDFLRENVNFVILGTGDKQLELSLEALSKLYPDKFKLILGFSEELAHKIYASSDYFVMPSKYEPCGLGQLIALRYGTLPVVHAVGGLKDTVDNYNEYTNCGNGFSFEEYSSYELYKSLSKAKEFFFSKDKFTRTQINAMNCDFSWNNSALKYIKLFEELIQK